jgi:TetR/AcrR family transcriptional repressor of nem operon
MATKGERTREKFLIAAEALVLDRGFAATSLDDILRATGFTKGAFFIISKGKPSSPKRSSSATGRTTQNSSSG